MEAKQLFKKLVRDAQVPLSEEILNAGTRTMMSYGSQRTSDFAKDKKNREHLHGRFSHLTDDYIDGLDDQKLEEEMVSFIYRSFQQR